MDRIDDNSSPLSDKVFLNGSTAEVIHWDAEPHGQLAEMTRIEEATNHVRSLLGESFAAQVAIICGSGLGHIINQMADSVTINYDDVPHFPRSTVRGHGNAIVAGTLNGVHVVVFQGRFHFYEGHSMSTVVMPIRIVAQLGISKVIITNAAGALNEAFNVGDVMVIEDHISFPSMAGINPLRGPNNAQLGPRFPSLTRAYHVKSYDLVMASAESADMASSIRRGVYVNVGGPSYETAAEVRFIRMAGGDVVGMSTVPEVVAAAHAGLTVVAISQVTNKCIANKEVPLEEPRHKDVLLVSQSNAGKIANLIAELVAKMAEM